MGYAHNNVPFAPKPKTPPPPKKDNPAKDAICHQCGEVGHWRRNCPVYLTELMKKKKLPQGASASGLRGSRKLKQMRFKSDTYGRWFIVAAVEAIGNYH
ncbi:zinc finger, CCHC-type containing protein [Tanacetum coccineum]